MRDMYNTFNMGIGMVLALPADDAEKKALKLLREEGNSLPSGHHHNWRRCRHGEIRDEKYCCTGVRGGTTCEALLDAQARGDIGTSKKLLLSSPLLPAHLHWNGLKEQTCPAMS